MDDSPWFDCYLCGGRISVSYTATHQSWHDQMSLAVWAAFDIKDAPERQTVIDRIRDSSARVARERDDG